MKTQSENQISFINQNIFFREFTFSKNDFKGLNSKQQLEFADNVVWIEDIFFIFQIKEKELDASDDRKWFQSKILNKAVKQIKATTKYLSEYSDIHIENEKGHKINIAQAKDNPSRKIIIYQAKDFSEQLRQIKFYESTEIGLIHLFHEEDYTWICRLLLTPCEINEYLSFRERLFLFDKRASAALPEQYFLSHFLETPDADHFNAKYINSLLHFDQTTSEFDISGIMENFAKNIKMANYETEYYPILAELALLNRFELAAFKQKYSLCVQESENQDFTTPYRMYVPRTDCAFVFIPLHSKNAANWANALDNYAFALKYDSKASRCIGAVVFRDPNDKEYFQIFWNYIHHEWVFDQELEDLLNDNYLFRASRVSKTDNRYRK
ncbi:hypothetical protein NYQ10_15460 [Flavobacterium johnsoniae]|uniref:Uncharacterized protein n=1 Tax=Flavobacterium defluvii TaxID=370979 RepID=A0A1M5J9U5_9FLAO|nr:MULTISPECIES: hypothetical protein [Flavobacterium]PTT19234.1 hypothetical protein DBR27_00030 [Flavobacterium sp. HMWF030]WJS93488.1 hypothetical protein NYQ10_15460 [Flavobacterium johnsoniae]SHG36793.1 hypothetical protein SAMN05443663_102639 [Flavobacterium defluvii]